MVASATSSWCQKTWRSGLDSFQIENKVKRQFSSKAKIKASWRSNLELELQFLAGNLGLEVHINISSF